MGSASLAASRAVATNGETNGWTKAGAAATGWLAGVVVAAGGVGSALGAGDRAPVSAVFAAPDSPLLEGEVTLQRLAEAPWILREHGSGTREIVDYLLLSHLPAFHLGMELGNSEAIKHAVRHGLGISCLSRRVVAEQLEVGSLVELTIPLPRLTRTLWRIHHRQKHISKALQRFLHYCDV